MIGNGAMTLGDIWKAPIRLICWRLEYLQRSGQFARACAGRSHALPCAVGAANRS